MPVIGTGDMTKYLISMQIKTDISNSITSEKVFKIMQSCSK